MYKEKPKKLTCWHKIIQFAIFPIIILSDIVFFVVFLSHSLGCTGTSSAMYATHAICRSQGELYLITDIFVFSIALLSIWLIVPYKWHGQIIRVIIVAYLFVGRLIILELLSQWQVVPLSL